LIKEFEVHKVLNIFRHPVELKTLTFSILHMYYQLPFLVLVIIFIDNLGLTIFEVLIFKSDEFPDSNLLLGKLICISLSLVT